MRLKSRSVSQLKQAKCNDFNPLDINGSDYPDVYKLQLDGYLTPVDHVQMSRSKRLSVPMPSREGRITLKRKFRVCRAAAALHNQTLADQY